MENEHGWGAKQKQSNRTKKINAKKESTSVRAQQRPWSRACKGKGKRNNNYNARPPLHHPHHCCTTASDVFSRRNYSLALRVALRWEGWASRAWWPRSWLVAPVHRDYHFGGLKMRKKKKNKNKKKKKRGTLPSALARTRKSTRAIFCRCSFHCNDLTRACDGA